VNRTKAVIYQLRIHYLEEEYSVREINPPDLADLQKRDGALIREAASITIIKHVIGRISWANRKAPIEPIAFNYFIRAISHSLFPHIL
jgi:hypothetical protein